MAHDDYDIFRAAHEGDFVPLIELLRSGAELTTDRRDLVIKILEGKLRRPNHRQVSLKTEKRHRAIFERVHDLEFDGWKSTAAIRQFQEEFKCSESTVRKACRPYRGEWAQTVSFLNLFESLDERTKDVCLCIASLMVAEKMWAVGLSHDDLDKYPPEVLAEARSLMALGKAKTGKSTRKKVPT